MRFALFVLVCLLLPGNRSVDRGQQHDAGGIYFEAAMSMIPGEVPLPPGGRAKAPDQRPMAGQHQRNVMMTVKGWNSEDKTRVETTGRMGVHISIINKTGRYQLQPTMKTAIRSDLTKSGARNGSVTISMMDPSAPFDPKRQLVNAEQVGAGSVCGIECTIWQGEPPTSRPSSSMLPTRRHPMKVWMAKSGKPAFPLKMEVSGVGRNRGTVTTATTKLKFLDRIPASLFVVPKGYKIRQAPPVLTRPKNASPAKGKSPVGPPD